MSRVLDLEWRVHDCETAMRSGLSEPLFSRHSTLFSQKRQAIAQACDATQSRRMFASRQGNRRQCGDNGTMVPHTTDCGVPARTTQLGLNERHGALSASFDSGVCASLLAGRYARPRSRT